MDINEFIPMFKKYNTMYDCKVQFGSKARQELLEKALEFCTKEELEEYVLSDSTWIDTKLKSIISNRGIKKEEPVTPELKVEEPKEEIKENKKMENTVANELQTVLIDAIAKYSVSKVADDVMPLVREKIIKEFGVLPVTHEIKVGSAEPVKIKAELPPCFDRILAYVSNGNNVTMTGPAGTGKGFIARQVAKACGAEFYEVNAVKNNYELTGFVDANSRYVKTPFYDACKASSEGKKVVFLFDEMDCSDAESLKVFNEALEAREFTFPNDEKISFENMMIMSACNTFGTGADEIYCGQQLDASTLNRFVLIRVDYNRKVELSIAKGDEELVDFIDTFRRQTEKNGLLVVISYRNLKQIVSMKGILPLKQVMKDCLVKSMSDDDLANILNNICGIVGENRYFKATKGENVEWGFEQVA